MSNTQINTLDYDRQLTTSGVLLQDNSKSFTIKQTKTQLQKIYSNDTLNVRQFFMVVDINGQLIDPRTSLKSLCYVPPGYFVSSVLTKQVFDIRFANNFKQILQSQDSYKLIKIGYLKKYSNDTQINVVVTGYGFINNNQLVNYENTKTFLNFQNNYQINLNIPKSYYIEGKAITTFPYIDINSLYYDNIQLLKNDFTTAFNNQFTLNNQNKQLTIQIATQVTESNQQFQQQFQDIQKTVNNQLSEIKNEFNSYITQQMSDNISIQTTNGFSRQSQQNILTFQDNQLQHFQDIIWDQITIYNDIKDLQPVFTYDWKKTPYQFINLDLLTNSSLQPQPYIGLQGLISQNNKQEYFYVEMQHQQINNKVLQFSQLLNDYSNFQENQLKTNISYKGWKDIYGSLPETVLDGDYFQVVNIQQTNLPSINSTSIKSTTNQIIYNLNFDQINTQIPKNMKMIGFGEDLNSPSVYFIFGFDNCIQEIINDNKCLEYYQTFTNTLSKSIGFVDVFINNKVQTLQYGNGTDSKNLLLFDFVKYGQDQLKQINTVLQTQEFQNMAKQYLSQEEYDNLLLKTQVKQQLSPLIFLLIFVLIILVVGVVLIILKRKKKQIE